MIDTGKLLLRLGLGAILLFHGVYKVMHGVAWIKEPLAHMGLPGILAYGAYVAEAVAPLLLIVGLLTRTAAVVVAVNMVMAIVLVQRPQLLTVKPSGGGWGIELEALLLVVAVSIACLGAGRYSTAGK